MERQTVGILSSRSSLGRHKFRRWTFFLFAPTSTSNYAHDNEASDYPDADSLPIPTATACDK